MVGFEQTERQTLAEERTPAHERTVAERRKVLRLSDKEEGRKEGVRHGAGPSSAIERKGVFCFEEEARACSRRRRIAGVVTQQRTRNQSIS